MQIPFNGTTIIPHVPTYANILLFCLIYVITKQAKNIKLKITGFSIPRITYDNKLLTFSFNIIYSSYRANINKFTFFKSYNFLRLLCTYTRKKMLLNLHKMCGNRQPPASM